MKLVLMLGFVVCVAGCGTSSDSEISYRDSASVSTPIASDSAMAMDSSHPEENFIDTKNVSPEDLVAFALRWQHIPYLYASADPNRGFDCSGFIYFVFNHFNIDVPRSSVEFTEMGRLVSKEEARKADLILFTGTDSLIQEVGHMGIVIDNSDSLRFIHSSSGKAQGVTITALNEHYIQRFVSVRRIFPG